MAWVGLGILHICICLDFGIHAFNPTNCRLNGQGKKQVHLNVLIIFKGFGMGLELYSFICHNAVRILKIIYTP